MATIKKIKKAQSGIKSYAQFPGSTREIDTVGYAGGKKTFPLKITKKDGNTSYEKVNRSVVDKSIKKAKAKKGGSFDLNKDGKTTFKDVLIGRGVLPKTARGGMKVKKYQNSGDPLTKESKNPYVIGRQKKLEKVKSEGNPNNPPLKSTTNWKPILGIGNSGGVINHETDTSGYSAGRKEFITKSTSPTGQTKSQITSRQAVNSKLKKPNSTVRFIPTTLKKGKNGSAVKKTMKSGGKMIMKRAQAGATLPKAEIPMKKTKPSSNVSKIKVAMKKGGKMTKKCAYGCK